METLAVVDSIKRFKIYLTRIHFKIVTDCAVVRSTFTKRDLLSRLARWWVSIQDFDFDIEHRSGETMKHVDALSRNVCVTKLQILTIADGVLTIQIQDEALCTIAKKLNAENCDKSLKQNYSLRIMMRSVT